MEVIRDFDCDLDVHYYIFYALATNDVVSVALRLKGIW